MKVKCQWKTGSQIRVSAAVAYAAMEQLRSKKGGAFRRQDLVDAARAKRHPLHKVFEWKDSVAAEKYRIEQAGYLIRSLEVIKVLPKKKDQPSRTVKLRVYEVWKEKKKPPEFRSTEEMLSEEAQRSQILMRVWQRLVALRREYNDYSEFAGVWSAIDKTESRIAELS